MRDISRSAALEELRAGGNAAEPSWRVWGILVSIVSIPLVVAEIMTTFGEPRIGLILYSVLLIVLLAHATLRWEFPIRSLLLSLTLIPLIRIISLTLPLSEFAPIFGYFLTGVPLFVATALIVRTLHWTWQEVGVAMGQLRLQALVAISGLVFGYVQYQILRPQPLAKGLTLEQLWAPVFFLLVYVAFVEELIFRGLLQRAAMDVLGRLGVLYVAILYSVLHLGYQSLPEMIVVFCASLLFGWVRAKTGSIAGTMLGHGLSNITLFVLLPLLLGNR